MARRKIYDEQDAQRCLRAARGWQGGLPAWARAHGVDGRSLNAWNVNLAKRGVPRKRATPKLVELVPKAVSVRAGYVLRIGGVELELGDGFDEQIVRRLVGLLKSC